MSTSQPRRKGAVPPSRMAPAAWSYVLWLLAAMVVAGCSPKTDRLPLNGSVTLDGVPLDNGSIRFTSRNAAAPMSSGALIQDGAYNMPAEKGLLPGGYHVEISSPDTKAPPVLDRASGMKTAPERIPPDYNIESKQSVEVTRDGDNKFNFHISTSAK